MSIPKTKANNTAGVIVWLLTLFYLFFFNHVGANAVGLAYDTRQGTFFKQPTGWHFTAPWVFSADYSTVPFKVEFMSGAKVNNVFILRFRHEYYADYIAVNGYDWIFDLDFRTKMLGYHISGLTFPFVENVAPTERTP